MPTKGRTTLHSESACPSKAEQRRRVKRAASVSADNMSITEQPEAPRRSNRAAASKAREAVHETLAPKKVVHSGDSSSAPGTSRGRANNSRASSKARRTRSRSSSVGGQIEVKSSRLASRRPTRKFSASQPVPKSDRVTRGARKQQEVIWNDVDLEKESLVVQRMTYWPGESLVLAFKRSTKPGVKAEISNSSCPEASNSSVTEDTDFKEETEVFTLETAASNPNEVPADDMHTSPKRQKIGDLSVPDRPPNQGGGSPSVQLLEEASMNPSSVSPHTDNCAASPSAITIMKEADSEMLDTGDDAELFLEGATRERLPPSDEQDQILREALEKINSLSEDIPGNGGLSDAEPGADEDDDGESTSGEKVRLRFRASSMESEEAEDDPMSQSHSSSVIAVAQEHSDPPKFSEELQTVEASGSPPTIDRLDFDRDDTYDSYERTIVPLGEVLDYLTPTSMLSTFQSRNKYSLFPDQNIGNREDILTADALEPKEEPTPDVPDISVSESRSCLTENSPTSHESDIVMKEMGPVRQDRIEQDLQLPNQMQVDEQLGVSPKSSEVRNMLPEAHIMQEYEPNSAISSRDTFTPDVIMEIPPIADGNSVDSSDSLPSSLQDEAPKQSTVPRSSIEPAYTNVKGNDAPAPKAVEESLPPAPSQSKLMVIDGNCLSPPSSAPTDPIAQPSSSPLNENSKGSQLPDDQPRTPIRTRPQTPDVAQPPKDSQEVDPEVVEVTPEMSATAEVLMRMMYRNQPDTEPEPAPDADSLDGRKYPMISAPYAPKNLSKLQIHVYRTNWRSLIDGRVCMTCGENANTIVKRFYGLLWEASRQGQKLVLPHHIREPLIFSWHAHDCARTIIDCRDALLDQFARGYISEDAYALIVDPTDSEWGDDPDEGLPEEDLMDVDDEVGTVYDEQDMSSAPKRIQIPSAEGGKTRNEMLEILAKLQAVESGELELEEDDLLELLCPELLSPEAYAKPLELCETQAQKDAVCEQLAFHAYHLQCEFIEINMTVVAKEDHASHEPQARKRPTDKEAKMLKPSNPLLPDPPQVFQDKVQADIQHFRHDPSRTGMQDNVGQRWDAERATRRTTAQMTQDTSLPYPGWNPYAKLAPGFAPNDQFVLRADGKPIEVRAGRTRNQTARIQTATAITATNSALTSARSTPAVDEPSAGLPEGMIMFNGDGSTPMVPAKRGRGRPPKNAQAPRLTDIGPPKVRGKPGPKPKLRPEVLNEPPKLRGKPGPKPKPNSTDQAPVPSKVVPVVPTAPARSLRNHTKSVEPTAPRAASTEQVVPEPEALNDTATDVEAPVLNPKKRTAVTADLEDGKLRSAPEKRETRRSSKLSAEPSSTTGDPTVAPVTTTVPIRDDGVFHARISTSQGRRTFEGIVTSGASPQQTTVNSRQSSNGPKIRISAEKIRVAIASEPASDSSSYESSSEEDHDDDDDDDDDGDGDFSENLSRKHLSEDEGEFNDTISRKRQKKEYLSTDESVAAPTSTSKRSSNGRKKRGRPLGSKTKSITTEVPAAPPPPPVPSPPGRPTRRRSIAAPASSGEEPPRLKLTHHAKEQLDKASDVSSASTNFQKPAPSVASTRSGRSGWYEYGYLETAEDKFRAAAELAALNPNATGRPQRKRKVCETAKEPVVVKRVRKEPVVKPAD